VTKYDDIIALIRPIMERARTDKNMKRYDLLYDMVLNLQDMEEEDEIVCDNCDAGNYTSKVEASNTAGGFASTYACDSCAEERKDAYFDEGVWDEISTYPLPKFKKPPPIDDTPVLFEFTPGWV
jgi:hypothetical protein